jgi:hypothetical protein
METDRRQQLRGLTNRAERIENGVAEKINDFCVMGGD